MQLLVILMGLMLISPQTASKARDVKAIEAAQKTSASQIDASLPKTPIEQWLRETVGPEAKIVWEVNDCGEQTGNPSLDKGRDFPMCAEAQVVLSGKRKLFLALAVGTFKSGVSTGHAKFFYALIMGSDGSRNPVKRLGELPEAIRRIK
jgi:hypothetical protein